MQGERRPRQLDRHAGREQDDRRRRAVDCTQLVGVARPHRAVDGAVGEGGGRRLRRRPLAVVLGRLRPRRLHRSVELVGRRHQKLLEQGLRRRRVGGARALESGILLRDRCEAAELPAAAAAGEVGERARLAERLRRLALGRELGGARAGALEAAARGAHLGDGLGPVVGRPRRGADRPEELRELAERRRAELLLRPPRPRRHVRHKVPALLGRALARRRKHAVQADVAVVARAERRRRHLARAAGDDGRVRGVGAAVRLVARAAEPAAVLLLLRLREGAAVRVGGEVAAEVVPPRRPVHPSELPPLVRVGLVEPPPAVPGLERREAPLAAHAPQVVRLAVRPRSDAERRVAFEATLEDAALVDGERRVDPLVRAAAGAEEAPLPPRRARRRAEALGRLAPRPRVPLVVEAQKVEPEGPVVALHHLGLEEVLLRLRADAERTRRRERILVDVRPREVPAILGALHHVERAAREAVPGVHGGDALVAELLEAGEAGRSDVRGRQGRHEQSEGHLRRRSAICGHARQFGGAASLRQQRTVFA